jgi:hypothetical protein
MAKLTEDQKLAAMGFLNDLFIAGGILDKADSKRADSVSNYIAERTASDAKVVCDEIKFRSFDFFNVDNALRVLSSSGWFWVKAQGATTGKYIKKPAPMLAKYIASFCKSCGIYWDDVNTNRTTNEMDQYRASVFGGALWDFDCFLSQNVSGANQSQTQATSGQPKNDYKSQGPQSSKARALIGTPGQKEHPTGDSGKIFTLEFDKKGANVPCLFIDPLGSKGADGSVTPASNKVLEGSAKGYTDCAACFNTVADADAFMQNYVKLHNLTQQTDPTDGTVTYSSQKYAGLRVRTARLNQNGYYKMGTDCGECYINAVKLNEGVDEGDEATLTEDAKKEADAEAEIIKSKEKLPGKYNIMDIDVYSEAFDRE